MRSTGSTACRHSRSVRAGRVSFDERESTSRGSTFPLLDGRARRPAMWGPEDFHFVRAVPTRPPERRVQDAADAGAHLDAGSGRSSSTSCSSRSSTRRTIRTFSCSRHSGAPRAVRRVGCARRDNVARDVSRRRHEVLLAELQAFRCIRGVRVRRPPDVHTHLLSPDDEFALDLGTTVDAACCLTVFEHLNEPLRTAEALHAPRAARPALLRLREHPGYRARHGSGGTAARRRPRLHRAAVRHRRGQDLRRHTGLVVAAKKP